MAVMSKVPPRPVRGATYNGDGMALDSVCPDRKAKREATISNLTSLLDNNDWVAVQEEHSEEGRYDDTDPYSNPLTHRLRRLARYGNPLSRNKGGVAIYMNDNFHNRFTFHNDRVIKGRVQALICTAKSKDDTSMIIINVHLPAGADWKAKLHHLQVIDRYLGRLTRHQLKHYRLHMTGDFNFVESPGKDVTTASHSDNFTLRGRFRDHWSRFKSRYRLTEAHQPVHTHYGRTSNGPVTSRLDRHYIGMSQAEWTRWDVKATVCNVPHAPLSKANVIATDHQPVRVSITPAATNFIPSNHVEDWVARHPAFREKFKDLLGKNKRPASIRNRVSQMTRLIQEARRHVKSSVQNAHMDHYDTLHLHLSLFSELKSKGGDFRAISSLLSQNPGLKKFVIPSGTDSYDTGPLETYIDSLYKRFGDLDEDSSNGSSDPTSEKDGGGPHYRRDTDSKCDGIRGPRKSSREDRITAILPSSRTWMTELQSMDEEPPTNDPKEMAKILKDYWGSVWSDAPEERAQECDTASYLKGYNKKIKHSLIKDIDIELVKQAIADSGDSAPGTDGVPFIVYKVLIDEVAPIFLELAKCMMRSEWDPPDDFNLGKLFFFPKTNSARVDRHRPITVGQTMTRIVASIFRLAVMDALNDIIDENQKAYLSGRKIEDNITFFNARFQEAKDRGDQYYFILIDFAKAFDSLSHDFIHRLLEWVGLPLWFRNAVRHLFHNVQGRTTLRGEGNTTINFERGIKQGCPLSPLLFCLVMDVFMTKLGDFDKRAYADDVGIGGADLRALLTNLTDRAREFATVSGLKLNVEKTVILSTKTPSDQDINTASEFGVRFVDSAKYLGVLMGRDVEIYEVFQEATNKLGERVDGYLKVGTNFYMANKVHIANTRLLPLYSYLMLLFQAPDEVREGYEWHLRRWLFRGNPKAPLSSLYHPPEWLGLQEPLKYIDWWGTAVIASRHNGTGSSEALRQVRTMTNYVINDHRAAAVQHLHDRFKVRTPDVGDPYGEGGAAMGGGKASSYYSSMLLSDFSIAEMSNRIRKRLKAHMKDRVAEVVDLHSHIRPALAYTRWTQMRIVYRRLPTAEFYKHLHHTKEAREGSIRPHTDEDACCYLCGEDRDSADHLYYHCKAVQSALTFLVANKGVHKDILLLKCHDQAVLAGLPATTVSIYTINRIVCINYCIWTTRCHYTKVRCGVKEATRRLADAVLLGLSHLPRSYRTEGAAKMGGGFVGGSSMITAIDLQDVLDRYEGAPWCSDPPGPRQGEQSTRPLSKRDTAAAEALSRIDKISPSSHILYTDGGGAVGGGIGSSGAGAILVSPPSPPHPRGTAIMSFLPIIKGTNNIGELAGIVIGLDLMDKAQRDGLITDNLRVVVATDSKYAIKVCTQPSSSGIRRNSTLIRMARDRLHTHSLGQGNTIELLWVAGHNLIYGNECGDALATMARNLASRGTGWPPYTNNYLQHSRFVDMDCLGRHRKLATRLIWLAKSIQPPQTS